MKRFFSRYHPRFIRSLVYMLQASEYNVRDYVAWLSRVEDFTLVEKRRHIVITKKARILLVTASACLFVFYGAASAMLFLFEFPKGIILFSAIILFSPIILQYAILVPLVLFQVFVQRPITRQKIKRARQKLEKHPAIKIGIAGSFGKTSMREILKTVLTEGKKVAAPGGSHNTPLGIAAFVDTLKGDEEVLIFELGEYYPGDITALCKMIDPDIGIITGVNEAHLEKFGDLHTTAKTIFELADYLGHRPLYVNSDNEEVKKFASKDHILYGRDGVDHLAVENPHTDLSGTSFVLTQELVHIKVQTKLLGLHHIGALSAAADIGIRLGLTVEEIARGLAKTAPFDHRLEPKIDQSGVITLDDSYNGNPDGVAAVIDFLASLSGKRRFYVTPGLVEMGARKEEVHREIGKRLAFAGIEKVILVRNSVTQYIEKGLRENNFQGEVLWYNDALAAFTALPYLTVKGDVVLLQNDWTDQYA
ncbi:MAG: UDP-N-acetylmuramoyl-tripeptide--D-alanyl-D-alanine ligase MurF [Parcubacteria group bacterium Gr01-1014_48]|nr:MAG: UDP-N-acetylmuramoyl-tripeptide--D-alanyl-D-alanine ligase MurF [Parcubacteria group bacterium Greene0416_14]TSC72076.1 MAG: UDP-N-acetylmuramoyl-tripeptide--D-alanyl-D-alanine ligase MurF [Parcubacteria group bacterium Gr01-1014_48]TSC99741.1 MAG: UDP-N-acetylmuramoyl-tripeptide--D-alanyl-D-alanine ligase MurF [Parcubacteria group bacterium Greene1014_15]TSD07043.1 MAG: UDP-N-acetylmuramoyl-tripeptide--D-alanyl-D-alanine ligase MurF [Parcubacteria group bacterium Greene0714_4]